MTDATAVTVKIMDRDFKVSCTPEEKRRLVDAAEMLDERMRKIKEGARMAPLDKVAILAGLNLAAEFLELKDKHSNLDSGIGNRIKDLNRLLAGVAD